MTNFRKQSFRQALNSSPKVPGLQKTKAFTHQYVGGISVKPAKGTSKSAGIKSSHK